ncbi:MAG: bifunctional riboflavin kinase/FAD synthetase [Limisphaerales bacterium]
MRILSKAEPLGSPSGPVHLALGVFDGVHLGHQMVILQTVEDARASKGASVVVTFDRHPASVVDPANSPGMIQPLWRRLGAIEELSVDAALVLTFDEELSRLSAEVFVLRLRKGFGKLAGICVGSGFAFGHRRSGNVETLTRMGREGGFEVRGIPPLQLGGDVVSSSRVRELVGSGDFPGASRLLGRPYEYSGIVMEGDQIGRTLGFPTANLESAGMQLPPTGVYAAVATVQGTRKPAAVNIGVRPTVDGVPGPVRVEAHVLDFEGDLYGERVSLEFQRRLRGEEEFPSVEKLAAQIARDVESVRRWARNGGLP